MNGLKRPSISIYIFFAFFSLLFVIPFLMIISTSLTEETAVLESGYRLIPKKFDFSAYEFVFKNPKQLLDSYMTTILYSTLGTFISLLIMTLMAYPLSRPVYIYRKQISFLIFFTMLFNGGLIPTYILNTRYLSLGDTLWIYMLPNAVNAFYIIVIRTFFGGLPPALIESAKIDGASELRIFFKIILPLSKPVLATVALLILLARWNDWNTALIYIKSKSLYSLQYLLQRTLMDAKFVRDMSVNSPVVGMEIQKNIPTETVKFAMCIVAAGPMVAIFPFFQKYFTTGLTVGAVKG